MTETASDRCQLFVSPAANGAPGDGTATSPFGHLRQALSEIAERQGQQAGAKPTAGYDQIEVAAIMYPGASLKRRGRPRHEVFVDPLAADDRAPTGKADAPFQTLADALAHLHRRLDAGELVLEPGERLRISVREVFTVTPIDRRKRRTEYVARAIFLAMTVALIIPVLLILTYLVSKAWPALSWSFVVENPRNNMKAGGIWAPLIGTFYLVFCSLAAAAPIGILAGVYLNEYARDNWFTRIVNLAVVNLAGVPSIVHALFGMGAFVTFAHMGASVLAASCTLAVMTLPVIITSTKEALGSVPLSFRMACWNMGASRWQTIRSIVLPNSISGILTGVILQVSRAAGETAPILFTGAVLSMDVADSGWGYFFPYELTDGCMALSYHLYAVTTQATPATAQQIASGEAMPLEHIQFGTAVVLIGLVLVVNSLSIGLRTYLRSRKKW
jgi:phosphate transport system permease protein